MKLSLPIISSKMKYKIVDICISDKDTRELMSTRLFETRLNNFDINCVYIGKMNDILSCQDTPLPMNIICVGLGDIAAIHQARNYNIMVVEGPGVREVLNEVQGIFDFFNQIDTDLTKEIMLEGSLQSILDICSRFFDNPIFVVDSAKKLIAQSSNLKDPEWADIEKTGYVGVDVLNRMVKLDLLHENDRKPQINKEDNIPSTITTGIFENNEKIGSVGVKELYSKISSKQFGLLEHVSEMLTILLNKEKYARYVKTNYSNRFMIDLIKGAVLDEKLIRGNLARFGWNFDDKFMLLKIIPNPKDIESGTLKYSGELVKNFFPGSVMLINRDIVIIVINLNNNQNDISESFSMLEDFLGKRNCTCGASLPFNDFSLISEQYKLASTAVDVGQIINERKCLFKYQDYIMPHVISICDQKLNIKSLCNPMAILLNEFDIKNHSSYLYTLYVYLKNGKSLIESAKLLNIHRSTLIYRLNKIAEIIDTDLNNIDYVHMIFSYEILKFMESRI